ncbi:GGDEF domain-containing protein [Neptuniibacter sp.]|uniref:GGDEF domain-containing protein n=1 Tax=Neptuniibacter sp. TaxID=1962643 RepID=UPI00262639E3|nr:GGDEF domain-containing protein [Neptuniibacter sp.]MCP4596984.1 GGDEF domain-containing protein [Neptuniibacter sp.]
MAAQLSPEYQHIVTLTPYPLALIVALLGYGFNRSRILFAALNLIAAYWLIQIGLQTSLNQPDAFVLFSMLSLLLPVHLALISLYKERGLLTPIGIIRVLLIVLSYLPLYVLLKNGSLALYLPDLPMVMLEMLLHEYYLSEAAALTFGLSLIPVFVSFILRKTYTDAALFAAIISALIMLSWFNQPLISALFVSASLIALAISVVQNSYRMAFIDELTCIPARRALQDKLSTLGKKYTLAMCDIDHFKKFNDTYGHDVGDQVLKMVAAKLNQVSGGGKAYRYGGEEFTLVFPGKNEAEALPYIEQLRETIANYPMHIRNQNRPEDNEQGQKLRKNAPETEVVSVTISIGFCEKTAELTDPQAVIKKADEALYTSKKNGRNCSTPANFQPEKKSRRRGQRHDYA